MLNISGTARRFCDGFSRRNFLSIGTLGLGGLTLAELLSAEQALARAGGSTGKLGHKAVILIYMPGGYSHQDTFDLKMDAPADIRGEFKPIKTNVSGIEICEQLPKMAAMMDKFAVVRSLVGARDEHANPLSLTGYPMSETNKNQPSLGAAVSRIWGSTDGQMPPYVDLIPKTQHKPYSIPAATGYLGRRYAPVRMDEEGAGDRVLRGITLDRLEDRRRLLASMDRFRRSVEQDPGMQSQDVAVQQAFNILTDSRLVKALDVSQEPAKLRESYGKGQDGIVGDACPCKNEQFLAARRLVEAGVRCVTLGYGFWDFHGGNFSNLKRYLPMFDQGISALVQDLHQRGLAQDVSVLVWGDFGRTPKINKDAGRDHWPQVASCVLAGGGMRTGQLIGTTTADGGYADERPLHYRDVLATIYHNLGFSVADTQVLDETNRPQWLLYGNSPVEELI